TRCAPVSVRRPPPRSGPSGPSSSSAGNSPTAGNARTRCRIRCCAGSASWWRRRPLRSTTSAAQPGTGGTPWRCWPAGRCRGPGRNTARGGGHAREVHRQRPADRGRRRLGRREPAVRAAGAPRAVGRQERRRAGRVRVVHGLPGRGAGVLLPGAGRAGARPRGAHRRGDRRRRPPAPGAGGVRRLRCGAVRFLHPGPGRAGARAAAAQPVPLGRRDPRVVGREPVPLHRLREDHGRGAAGRQAGGGRMSRVVIEGGAVAAVDDAGTEYAEGHVVVDGDRITAVGPGPAPVDRGAAERIDASGCLVTPGLVNTHHHLYQWATRGYAVDAPLFQWLTDLYPVWAGLDENTTRWAAAAGLARLASTGCTTAADHHYL